MINLLAIDKLINKHYLRSYKVRKHMTQIVSREDLQKSIDKLRAKRFPSKRKQKLRKASRAKS